jgi:O-6-methylguanine DNA methyltransferase
MPQETNRPRCRFGTDNRLLAVLIGEDFDPARHAQDRQSGPLPPSAGATPAWLADALAAFFARRPVTLNPADLDMDRFSAFSQQVLLYLPTIPVGRVLSYGALAAALGRPRAARAVGSALAANPFPLLLPCHRVVPADGTLGAYSRQADSPLKRRLLVFEGVPFTTSGHLALPAYLQP